ncbi:MAG: TLD domain-containing protein [Bacteroidetes bacterium]|nr:TLD domain-containing protein [Bacteroidota bacterium]
MRNKIYALLLLLFTTLVTQAQTSLLPGSLLADANDETTLSTWLNNNCAVGTLLYRKSVHGASSSTFHSLCDNQGPTLVLIKNDATNTVFGGFANASWVSGYYGYYGWYGQYISAPGSFLFNLTTNQKADLINSYDYSAMYGNNNYGPVFGGGNDIFMNSDMTYVQV